MGCKYQLLRVADAQSPGFMDAGHIYAVTTSDLCDERREILVKVEAHRCIITGQWMRRNAVRGPLERVVSGSCERRRQRAARLDCGTAAAPKRASTRHGAHDHRQGGRRIEIRLRHALDVFRRHHADTGDGVFR